jgi:hypothetical protein
MSAKRPWRVAGVAGAALAFAACNNNNNTTSNIVPPGPPTGLVYQLNLGEQIGTDSIIEPGVLLSWLPPNPDSTVQNFIVYGSDSSISSGFVPRAVTTSVSFHDAGTPQLAYYVTSQDVNGVQSAASNIVVIDAGDTVETPQNLVGAPLDSAAELAWSDNSITGANGSHFDFYRVYSEDFTSNNCVDATLVLEGQSVSNGFVITGLANDVPRCYFVTAVTRTGHESFGSNAIVITPSDTLPPWASIVSRLPGTTKIVAHHPLAMRRAVLRRP